ncbi:MAG: ABC transporter substrate-binding protein [Candidatus Cryptobacteroides sp.]
MKKFVSLIAGLLFGAALLTSAADREHTLKIYNWADYIDEALLEEFKTWYKEQTGEDVEIIYQLFDVNEIMLSKIELGHEDFDVVCPSEYIIERMLRQDLLLKIDTDFGDTPNYISCISPYIRQKFNEIEGYGKNANDYAVGYMWGTTGLLYNPKYVTREEASSWECLKDPRFKDKILIKDAFRDVYTALTVALHKDQIDAGELTIADITFDASDEYIALVEGFLNDIKDNVLGWEADFGKEEMTKEKAWINLDWSGDAQWAIEEAEKVGVELAYEVPHEGSIVWFDGWVIPKYAKNIQAARYFINYMCMPENAIRNMDEIGYVSAIGGDEILDSIIDTTAFSPIDASYFFGENATAVCINPILYPDASIMERCGMMHDNGDRTEELLKMWSRVKGDNAGYFTYICIGVAVLALIAFLIFNSTKKKGKKRRK